MRNRRFLRAGVSLPPPQALRRHYLTTTRKSRYSLLPAFPFIRLIPAPWSITDLNFDQPPSRWPHTFGGNWNEHLGLHLVPSAAPWQCHARQRPLEGVLGHPAYSVASQGKDGTERVLAGRNDRMARTPDEAAKALAGMGGVNLKLRHYLWLEYGRSKLRRKRCGLPSISRLCGLPM